MTDVWEAALELGRLLYPGNEAAARRFAQGRYGSVAEAREAGLLDRDGQVPLDRDGQVPLDRDGQVPAELAGEVERSIAAEAAVFGLSREAAGRRVRVLISEKLPDTAAARHALLAHQHRLGVRR